jgi:hypothetical protein
LLLLPLLLARGIEMEELEEIKELLKEIKTKIDKLEFEPKSVLATTCTKCGIEFAGAMGYVCPHNYCPVQFRAF